MANLDDIDNLEVEPEKNAAAEEYQGAPIPIEQAAFMAAYDRFIDENLKDQHSLSAILKAKNFQFRVHEVVFLVANPVQRAFINDVRNDLTIYLRQACQNPSIGIKIEIDETLQPVQPTNQPLSREEIRALMEAKNPNFVKFQQTFGLAFVYN